MSASFNTILGIFKQDMILRVNDLDVVSNNLSNVNTTGFKSSRSNFQEVLESITPQGGSIINSHQMLHRQGSIISTGAPYDIAIHGEGFLSVLLPDGTNAYTRDGHLQVVENPDATLRLEHSSGYPLNVTWTDGSPPPNTVKIELGDNGIIGHQVLVTKIIQMPQYDENGNPVVDANGNLVMVDREYTALEFVQLGQINLTRFPNPSGLRINGENLFLASENSGEPAEGTPGTAPFGSIKTGALEQSTVDLGEEMSHLLALQRGLTLSARGFQETDKMLMGAIQMRR